MKATGKKTANLLKGKRIARYAAQVADNQPITFKPYTLQQIELLERREVTQEDNR